MENSKGPSSTIRNTYSGKHYSLPPKSPFPSITPFYPNYTPTTVSGPKGIPKYRDKTVNSYHQRTSSESILIEEEPPYWLDELLEEPETPVRKGHRRSSSDSFTYMEEANANIQHMNSQIEYRLRNMNVNSQSLSPLPPSWDFDLYKDARNASFYVEHSPMIKNKIESPTTNEKQDTVESCTQDANNETDTKHAKQQFAQRSRVRKLQYIAELERSVQVLQAEGSEVSGEIKFLNQKSLLLNMENKALKQRLENLAQEQLIKYLEYEVLEREIGRLRSLYKQQQQPPSEELTGSHRRTHSRDSVESQFAKLSFKNKESGAVSGPLRI